MAGKNPFLNAIPINKLLNKHTVKSTHVYLPLDYLLTLFPLKIFLNVLPRLLRMQMQPWTPNNDNASETAEATDRNGVFLVPCRRRSSMTLITKAEEYAMITARSELMFARLKERNGLMKSVLEKLRKYLPEFVIVHMEVCFLL